MKNFLYTALFSIVVLTFFQCRGQAETSNEDYTIKSGSSDGIGKWYKSREIAHVMGFQGMDWLERPEREKEENTSRLIQDMGILPSDTIADIGAGSGYHVLKWHQLPTKVWSMLWIFKRRCYRQSKFKKRKQHQLILRS